MTKNVTNFFFKKNWFSSRHEDIRPALSRLCTPPPPPLDSQIWWTRELWSYVFQNFGFFWSGLIFQLSEKVKA